jgi:methyl-accepting chemotaxis protein
MTLNISTRSIPFRLRLLVGLAMTITALIGGSAYFALSRAESLAEKQLGERLLLGEKARLELSSRMLADSLATTLSRLEGHEAQIAALRERVSGLRYESDQSGYFFVYEGTVCQVMGPNPALEEKDLADRVDSNGVHFIRELAAQARQGGGFVNYVFPKPGTTEQPKLSFAVMIPKTTFWIGTGVYIDHLARLQAEGTESMRAAVRPVVRGAGIGGALALLVLAGASLALERGISRPLRGVKEARATSAHQTTEASSQVANASQSLAAGASQQAASIEETSASLEEMRSMTRNSSEHAASAKTTAAAAREAAELGTAQMSRMAVAMGEIKESSSEIAKIIKTIDEIAFQTNLLALNAAVEAARAGESGAGFAVVADEVRSLAQRSASASHETAAKIAKAMERSQLGVELSRSVGDSLSTILQRSREVDSLVGEIATAAVEQNQGIQQIATAVSQMDAVVQKNAAGAEETAGAAEELSAQSIELQDVVHQLDLLVDGRRSAPCANDESVRLPPAEKCHPADDTPVRGSSRARRGSVALAG